MVESDADKQFISLFDENSLELVESSKENVTLETDKLENVPVNECAELDFSRSNRNLWCYSCEICKKMFLNKKTWSTHMKVHEEDKPFQCNYCDLAFNVEDNLSVHTFVHHFVNNGYISSFFCPICRKEFSRYSAAKAHIAIHEQDDTIKCRKCICSFSSQILYEKHLESCSFIEVNCNFKCKVCPVRLKNIGEYRKHMANNHPNYLKTNKKKLYVDGDTSDVSLKNESTSESKLSDRKSKEIARQVVSNVVKVQKRSSSIMKKPAVKSNKKRKDIICEECGKGFKFPSMLQRHMVVHTKENEFKCPYCTRSYSQKHSLKLHIASHAGADVNLIYERPIFNDLYKKNIFKMYHVRCRYCYQSFPSVITLQLHLKTHIADSIVKNKKFEEFCETSNKSPKLINASEEMSREAFRSMKLEPLLESYTLKRRNEKQWKSIGTHQCAYCGNKYVHKCHLTEHIKQAHSLPDPKFSGDCFICGKTFANASRLNRHIRFVHEKNGQVCKLCNKYYSSYLSLKRHMLVHDNIYKFSCPFCHRKFRSKYPCEKHISSVHSSIENPLPINPNHKNCYVPSSNVATLEKNALAPLYHIEPTEVISATEPALVESEIVYTRNESTYTKTSNCVHQTYAPQFLDNSSATSFNQSGRAYFSDLLNDITMPRPEEEMHLHHPQMQSQSTNYMAYGSVEESAEIPSFTEPISIRNQPVICDDIMYTVEQTNNLALPIDELTNDTSQNDNVIILQSALHAPVNNGRNHNSYSAAAYSNISYANVNEQIDDLVDQYPSEPGTVIAYDACSNVHPNFTDKPENSTKCLFPHISSADELCMMSADLLSNAETVTDTTPSLFVCAHCDEHFVDHVTLECHVMGQHALNVTPFVCRYCSRMHWCAAAMQRHLDVHESAKISDETLTFECSVCNRSFKSRVTLCVHIHFSHPPQRPDASFKCGRCGKSFQKISLLKKHLIRKCFTQIEANRWTSIYGSLSSDADKSKRKHQPKQLLRKDITSPKKQLVNGKISKLVLKRSKKKTRQLNRFVCNECNLWYTNQELLQTHMLIHSDSNEVSCPSCGIVSANLAEYREHKKICEQEHEPGKLEDISSCIPTLPESDSHPEEVTQIASMTPVQLNHAELASVSALETDDQSNDATVLTAHEVFTDTGEQYYVIPMLNENNTGQQSASSASAISHGTVRLTESEYVIFNMETNTYVPVLYSYPLNSTLEDEDCSLDAILSSHSVSQPTDLVNQEESVPRVKFKSNANISLSALPEMIPKPMDELSEQEPLGVPHGQSHGIGFTCDECGYHFTRRSLFQRHLYTHNGHRPYACSDCGARFAQPGTLSQHEETHASASRSFPCRQCGRGYGTLKCLRRHLKTMHSSVKSLHNT